MRMRMRLRLGNFALRRLANEVTGARGMRRRPRTSWPSSCLPARQPTASHPPAVNCSCGELLPPAQPACHRLCAAVALSWVDASVTIYPETRHVSAVSLHKRP